ncbi:MAG: small basic protein, partial [Planctomycetes bacterium]|nr:small basic protein [Planctomycetota bacterium]
GERFAGKRNVLKRSERILGLIRDEAWKEGDSVFSLPKTKIIAIKKKKKVKEKTAEGAATTAEGAAPAASSSTAPAKSAPPKA